MLPIDETQTQSLVLTNDKPGSQDSHEASEASEAWSQVSPTLPPVGAVAAVVPVKSPDPAVSAAVVAAAAAAAVAAPWPYAKVDPCGRLGVVWEAGSARNRELLDEAVRPL